LPDGRAVVVHAAFFVKGLRVLSGDRDRPRRVASPRITRHLLQRHPRRLVVGAALRTHHNPPPCRDS
jgi:hypothetical protein